MTATPRCAPTTADYIAHNAKIMAEFRANGGHCGGRWEGNPMLILTMTGAKSGRHLSTPLTYHRDGEAYVVMASAGGKPTAPNWYHNVTANPDVEIEVAVDGELRTMPALAAELVGDERDRVFADVVAAMPRFGEYESKAGRTVPLIGITPT